MYSYIVRRLAFGGLTVIGVSIIVFVVLRILPGDPLVAIFGPEGFTKLGLDLTHHKMVIVKSTQHFYAGFAPIASGPDEKADSAST